MRRMDKYLPMTIVFVLLVGGCVSPSGKDRFTPFQAAQDGNARPIDQKDIHAFGASIRPVDGETEARYRLAKYFQSIKKHRIAIGVLKDLVQTAPDHAEAYNAMGYSFDHLKEYKAAQGCYRMALAIDPDLDHVLNNLGYSYILDKNYPSAQETLKQAIAKNSAPGQYHKNLALAYFMTGAYDQASAEFRTGVDKAAAERLTAKLPVVADNTVAVRPQRTHESPKPGADATVAAVPERTTLAAADSPSPSEKAVEVRTESVSPVPAEQEPPDADKAMAGSPEIAPPAASDPTPSELAEISQFFLNPPVAAAVQPLNLSIEEPRKENVTVEVLNGNGVNRMATNVRHYLERCGIKVIRAANADHFGHSETVVYYQEGYGSHASDLAGLLPGPNGDLRLTEKALEGAPVCLLIGKDVAALNSLFTRGSRLEIANGNGVRGIAAKVGAHLLDRGIQASRLRDADHFSYRDTTVHYSPGQRFIARFIAKELPGNTAARLVEVNRKGSRIRVLLGSDMMF